MSDLDPMRSQIEEGEAFAEELQAKTPSILQQKLKNRKIFREQEQI